MDSGQERRSRMSIDEGAGIEAGTAVFETLVETASEGMFAIDETGMIVFVNPAVGRIFGYDPSELVGESIEKLVPGYSHDAEAFERHPESDTERLDREFIDLPGVHKDGHEVSVAISVREYEREDRWLLTGIVRETAHREERSHELEATKERYRTLIETAPDAIFLVNAETGVILDANDAAERLLGKDREEIIGRHQTDLHPSEEAERYEAAFEEHRDHSGIIRDEREFYVVHAEGHRIPIEISAGTTELDGERVVQGIFRDVTERKRRARELSRQRDELERLDRINTVIRRINRALIDADTRDDIETAVCERLTETGPYVFAWIGGVDLDDGRVLPRTWTGIEEGYLDEITVTTDGETAHGPTGRAVRTGEVHAMQDILGDPAYEPWREQANARGYQSSCAVPLGYEGTIYGVLNVYADQPNAFDCNERTVLSELGESIGHAINAVERKEALMTENCIELEFQVRDAVRPLIESLDSDASTVRFERTVRAAKGSYLVYATVTGMDGGRFRDAITDISGITRARRVGDGNLFELTMDDPPIISAVATHGGRVRSVVVEDGVLRFVAAFPYSVDVRLAVRAIQTAYADAKLIAQRRTDRQKRTPRNHRVWIDEQLTEKQRAALEAAHFSGFFEWPRASTGEEVADSLGIAAPTFSQHLRAAERKVFAALFRESAE